MEQRTIATHGGGDLIIGGGPPIDGVLHCWHYDKAEPLGKRLYSLMMCEDQAEKLKDALGLREERLVRTFNGNLRVTFTNELANLWFYAYGESSPEHVIRLYEGAIDAAVDAIGEQLNPMVPMPTALHDASLTAPARAELEQLLAEGLVRKAA